MLLKRDDLPSKWEAIFFALLFGLAGYDADAHGRIGGLAVLLGLTLYLILWHLAKLVSVLAKKSEMER